jgi:hypothetical protein
VAVHALSSVQFQFVIRAALACPVISIAAVIPIVFLTREKFIFDTPYLSIITHSTEAARKRHKANRNVHK